MYPKDLKYSKEHEWIRVEGEEGIVGITYYAQDQLGDVVFVELPEVGREIEQNDVFGTVESVKSVNDLFAPVSGKVLKVNERLLDEPEIINEDPYGEGWMIVVEIKDHGELDKLLSADEYEDYIKSL